MTNPLQVRPGDGGVEESTVPIADTGSDLPVSADRAGVDGSGGGHDAAPSRNISRGQLVVRRFVRKKLAMFGVVLIVALVLAAWIGPHLTHWTVAGLDPDYTQANHAPDAKHWFGTDEIGHDLFVQTMAGLRKSLLVGLIGAFVSTFVAAVVGSIAGYFGGATNIVLMWIVDLLLVLPNFLILAILSPELRNRNFIFFALALAAFQWQITARVVRGMTLSLREREFVSAARFLGVKPATIIVRHILPNMASFLIVDVTLNVSSVILAETGLSFLGFGIQPPNVSLGTLIGAGTQNPGLSQTWLWFFPGAMLVLLTLGVNFVGDGLRDAVDATSGLGGN
jgi:peptide/nickel transport system permease protein